MNTHSMQQNYNVQKYNWRDKHMPFSSQTTMSTEINICSGYSVNKVNTVLTKLGNCI